jgi:hypothetical protein
MGNADQRCGRHRGCVLCLAGHSMYASKDSAKAARDSAAAAEDQARAVKEQTQLQSDLARAVAEPMLWVDIRGDDGTGQALVLLLGNAGSSMARNVKVIFDPPPPSTQDIKEVLEILERGIAAVAPGRTLEWVLGAAHNAVDGDARNEYKVRIEGETVRPAGAAPVRDHRQRPEGFACDCC